MRGDGQPGAASRRHGVAVADAAPPTRAHPFTRATAGDRREPKGPRPARATAKTRGRGRRPTLRRRPRLACGRRHRVSSPSAASFECRSGETGRRAGLKIPFGSHRVRVRPPPPAPTLASTRLAPARSRPPVHVPPRKREPDAPAPQAHASTSPPTHGACRSGRRTLAPVGADHSHHTRTRRARPGVIPPADGGPRRAAPRRITRMT